MRHVDPRSITRLGASRLQVLIIVASVVFLVALSTLAIQHVREAEQRTQSINNLKTIGLAVHGHHDALRRLPFNGADWSDGKNKFTRDWKKLGDLGGSWGWQVVSYLEQSPGPASHSWGKNQPIPYFVCPARGRSFQEAETDYFINNYLNNPENAETPDNAPQKRKLDDITDGTANTVLLGHGNISTAEYGLPKGAVGSCSILNGGTFGTTRSGPNWVKGQPLSVALQRDSADPPDFKLGGWGGPFPQGALMAMADATVRLFPYTTSGEAFAAFLTPTGGERVEVPD